MVERIECVAADCSRTILPSTAVNTDGFCMPCVQAKLHAEHRARVAAERVEVDRFAGVTDPVRVAQLLVQYVRPDELRVDVPYPSSLFEVVAEMSATDRERLVAHALECLRSDDEDAVDGGRSLAEALHIAGADIEALLLWLIDAGDPYPGNLYFEASDPVVSRLLEVTKVETSSVMALFALAWTRASRAVAQFKVWREQPPAIAGELHAPIETCLYEAGLALRGDTCVELCPRECRPIVEADGGVVRLFEPLAQTCEFCGDRLLALMDLDAAQSELAFLGIETTRLRIPMCARCSCFGSQFFDLEPDGAVRWCPDNKRPDYIADGEWGELPRVAVALAAPRHPAAAANWGAEHVAPSQLGGLPGWVQDSEYPECPGCRQPMWFVGQVACDDFEDNSEGVYYGFVCRDCRKSNVTYQQT